MLVMPKPTKPDPDEARRVLTDIGERRRAKPTRDEITKACLAARAAGIQVKEMAELTGIPRQWLHKNHLAES